MPMRYANEDDVLAQLRVTGGGTQYDRLVRMENGLCDTFDHKIGTSFGVAPVAETRTIVVGDEWLGTFGLSPYAYLGTSWSGPSPLITDFPLRSVTSITTGGIWNGAAWTGTTALAADQYTLTYTTQDGVSYGIELVSGYWAGPVHITGIWADQATLTVPGDVREALTFITVDEYRTRNASPADLSGPDGITVGTRNPWRFEIVKTAIDRHSVVKVLV